MSARLTVKALEAKYPGVRIEKSRTGWKAYVAGGKTVGLGSATLEALDKTLTWNRTPQAVQQ